MNAIAQHLSIRHLNAYERDAARHVAWTETELTAETTNAEAFQPHVGRRRAAPWRAGAAPSVLLHAVAAVHRLVYCRSGGRVGSRVRGRPVLLLTTRGRRSGKQRTTPVCFLVAGDRLVLAAAAGGRPRHPAWYLNLRADPRVAVRLGPRRLIMVAYVAQGAERAHLWERLCREYPICTGYRKRSGREIPVVVLRPALPACARRKSRRDVRL